MGDDPGDGLGIPVTAVSERPRGQRLAVVLSMALLVFTGLAGLYNGLDELRDARTPLQKTVTYGVLVYGVWWTARAATPR
jgi:hypothetical protein